MNEKGNPKIFISYSWASSERVLELAERLMANGVEVILDKWDLKEGQDKYAFMEQSVTDKTIDKVLIVCDKSYAEKANQRTGGVGDETVIISPEIYGQMGQERFIPVIFEVDADGNPYLPAYIKSRIYIDLSAEDYNYESEYEKLLRNIYNKPLYRKPALGTKPEWLENEKVELSPIRDLIKQTRGYTGGNTTKADFLMRKCADEFVNALMSYVPLDEKPFDEALLIQIDEVKPLRDLFIEYVEALIYADLDVGVIIPIMFEKFYNTSHAADEQNFFDSRKAEFHEFFLWELYICITATLLHYERFKELNKILNHTYYLRESPFSEKVKAFNFSKFRTYPQTIEEVCKPKSEQPRLHTLAGEMLLKREKKPIITRVSLATSDVVLFQLFQVFDLVDNGWDFWFPTVYYAVDIPQAIWSKLQSRSYCKKIMPLFGVSTIDELKEKISKCKVDREIRYSGSFEAAPSILSSIKLDEIGTVN